MTGGRRQDVASDNSPPPLPAHGLNSESREDNDYEFCDRRLLLPLIRQTKTPTKRLVKRQPIAFYPRSLHLCACGALTPLGATTFTAHQGIPNPIYAFLHYVLKVKENPIAPIQNIRPACSGAPMALKISSIRPELTLRRRVQNALDFCHYVQNLAESFPLGAPERLLSRPLWPTDTIQTRGD
ncbi:hypothetical protein B0H17DRAFT_1145006 [Mycena rosella]|uniref:Uncharacterized protein n=1 Tax=Mycena rosella TaxID=1033263 RepID=A0AAD7CV67_MYCRO|nr:hypothetical protein B0H17DRAFT_1145006 [Mycena rosella]